MENITKTLNLAKRAYLENRLEEAEEIFTTLIKSKENNFEIHYYLGLIYQNKKLINQSLHHFYKAYLLNEKSIDVLFLLAKTYLSLNQFQNTLEFTNHLLQIDAKNSEAHWIAGLTLLELNDFEKSHIHLMSWLLKKKQKEPLLYIYSKFIETNRRNEALAICKVLLEYFPNDIEARFCYCMTLLKQVYESTQDLIDIRKNYTTQLESLYHLCMIASKQNILEAYRVVGYLQPFFLPYQGENDRYLQSLYGAIVSKILFTKFPQFSALDFSLRLKQNRPIRVGFVSRFFKYHSNWKMRLKGWIKEMNKSDFSLYGYCTEVIDKKNSLEELTFLDKFVTDLTSIEEFAKCILEDEIDVLIYQEIGMDTLTMQLASFRLAPIQCASWGHPETSGFSTIDYFLSSDLMETNFAQEYYTEKLIKLPNLSVFYEPLAVSILNKSKKDFNLSEESVLCWCCQNLSKYLPQYDEVFIKIAKKASHLKFVFIEVETKIAKEFYQRIEKAFAKENLTCSDYCIFLPRLSLEEFSTVCSLMDIYLDSIGWSGCNSSLESIAFNLPIVTFPKNSMRSRHTAAMLEMMGLKEEIATSLDQYVDKALSLIHSAEKRLAFREKIKMNKEKLYRDKQAIIGLENFLKSSFNDFFND